MRLRRIAITYLIKTYTVVLIGLKLSSCKKKKKFRSDNISVWLDCYRNERSRFFFRNYGTIQVFFFLFLPSQYFQNCQNSESTCITKTIIAKQLNPELASLSMKNKTNCRSPLYQIYNSA